MVGSMLKLGWDRIKTKSDYDMMTVVIFFSGFKWACLISYCIILKVVIIKRVQVNSYFQKSILSPDSAIFQTFPRPPSLEEPSMMIARKPAIMTQVWNTSVHSTAFIPPWQFKQLLYGNKNKLCTNINKHESEQISNHIFVSQVAGHTRLEG